MGVAETYDPGFEVQGNFANFLFFRHNMLWKNILTLIRRSEDRASVRVRNIWSQDTLIIVYYRLNFS